jgi:hypothetical protein
MVIDRSKTRRQRKRTRKEIAETAKGGHLHGLYFDGRKDRTLINEKEGQKFYCRTITEEHIMLVQQPEGTFVGHITPSSGSAASIASGIVEFLTQHNVESLVAIGCDGTSPLHALARYYMKCSGQSTLVGAQLLATCTCPPPLCHARCSAYRGAPVHPVCVSSPSLLVCLRKCRMA